MSEKTEEHYRARDLKLRSVLEKCWAAYWDAKDGRGGWGEPKKKIINGRLQL